MENFRLYVVYAKTVTERSESPYEEAIEHYRELLRFYPGDDQLLFLLFSKSQSLVFKGGTASFTAFSGFAARSR
jgi:hypothetical protein